MKISLNVNSQTRNLTISCTNCHHFILPNASCQQGHRLAWLARLVDTVFPHKVGRQHPVKWGADSSTMGSLSSEQEYAKNHFSSQLSPDSLKAPSLVYVSISIHTSVTPVYSILKHETSQDSVRTEKDSSWILHKHSTCFTIALQPTPKLTVQGDKGKLEFTM